MKIDAASPILAITMGDPAGCGPEIIAKVLTSEQAYKTTLPFVVGSAKVMNWALGIIGQPAAVRTIHHPSEAVFAPGVVNVLEPFSLDFSDLQMGKIQPLAGRAAYEYLTMAIDLAMAGAADAVVTAPLNKDAMNQAGYHFDGHTEILAQRTGSKKVTMMLASKNFRVTHVSTHCSLREAIERCKVNRIVDVIHLTNDALDQMGISAPAIGVAGLNPHCGENGLFGNEDVEQIQVAIDQARQQGVRVHEAPIPPDTVFVRMAQFHEFDAVVAQYHDQGHIAAKLVDFWGGVNITLGLPIIRTSVDHGTAFGIVGSGKANPHSLFNAIEYASLMAGHRVTPTPQG
ncbi:MAG: 4-hydroxythreonine-4-phosphate dehydrogenase PdxA [Chloroflexota bacterium]